MLKITFIQKNITIAVLSVVDMAPPKPKVIIFSQLDMIRKWGPTFLAMLRRENKRYGIAYVEGDEVVKWEFPRK